jgi:transcriptional regulator with XRE-family HTH domain
MMGVMGYPEKLQKLCILRNLDQSTLASRLGLSKSSISRIISGVQEPKLRLAYDLAKVLGVTLDYLVDDSPEVGPGEQLLTVTEEELMILKIARRLGAEIAIDRLLNVPKAGREDEPRPGGSLGGRGRPDEPRFDLTREGLADATGAGAGRPPS